MAASLRCRTSQVIVPTLAQQAVPGAGGLSGEKLSPSAWCGDRIRTARPKLMQRPLRRVRDGAAQARIFRLEPTRPPSHSRVSRLSRR